MTAPRSAAAPKRSIAERLRSIPKKRAAPSAQPAKPAYAIPADDVFAAIRRNRNTQLPNQRAALALMDATEAALHARGLAFAPASYWAALFPVLIAPDRAQHAGTAAYLLSLLASRMSVAETLAVYSDVYGHMPRLVVERQADAPFVRAAIAVLSAAASAVLAAGDDVATERPSVRELLRILVALAADARPKVRHLAQSTLGSLYSAPALPAEWRNDAADAVCSVLSTATRKEHTEALHAMPLARALLLGGVDARGAALLLHALGRCTTLGNAPLSVLGLQTIAAFFEDGSCVLCDADATSLHRTLLASRPDAAPDVLPAWLAAMSAVPAAGDAAAAAVLECFGVAAAASSEAVIDSVEAAAARLLREDTVHAVCERLVRWLGVKNAPCAPHAIRLLGRAAAMYPCGDTMAPELCGVLAALGDAHDGKQGRHAAVIETAVGAFVRRFGPEAVLSVLPLNLVESGVRPRAWLLAVVRDSASRCRLAFFADALLPMAAALRERVAEYEAAGRAQDAKVYAVVVQQIWATLAAFLNAPRDAPETMPRIGQAVAEILAGDAEMRPTVLAALASFVARSRDGAEDCADAARDLRFFVEWGVPRFVPLLFNVFAATAPDARAGVVAALEAVMSVLPPAAQDAYLGRVVAKLQGVADDVEQTATLLELAAVLVRAATASDDASSGVLASLFGSVLRLLHGGDAVPVAVVKRAYRVLGDLLARDSVAEAAVGTHCDALERALLPEDSRETPSAAKRGRFRVLLRIFALLPGDRLHWVPLVLLEAVFGVKEANVRTRGLAFELVLAMARRMVRGGVISAARSRGILPADVSATLDEYVTMLMAGLAGRTPHMVGATILALARVLYDMHGLMVEEGVQADAADAGVAVSVQRAAVVMQLLSDMVALLGSASREIVKAVLGFVKVALVVLPADVFLAADADGSSLLSGLICGVLAWQGAHQMHFKERVRHLMERLVRRYGYERVLSLTPAEHHRLLHAIRKRREQAKRRRERKATDDAEDAAADDALSSATAVDRSTRFENAMADSSSDDDGEMDDAVLEAVRVDDGVDRDLSRRLRLAATLAGDGRRRREGPAHAESDEDGVAFDAAGKLVVRDDDDEVAAPSDDDDDAPAHSTAVHQAPAAKRVRAGGDVRRRTDRFEPYAYVPMARSLKTKKEGGSARFFKRR